MEVLLSQIESITWAWPFLWEPQLIFVPSSPPCTPFLSASLFLCLCLSLCLCLCLSLCLSLDRFFLHFMPLNGPFFLPQAPEHWDYLGAQLRSWLDSPLCDGIHPSQRGRLLPPFTLPPRCKNPASAQTLLSRASCRLP